MERKYGGDGCYFCDEKERIETHHIVPSRFDGSDDPENLVGVCPTCHSKLENLYSKRFYDSLGVGKGEDNSMPPCEFCGEPASGQTTFFQADPPYSRYRCVECAEERGWLD
jgi:hypothetical protein